MGVLLMTERPRSGGTGAPFSGRACSPGLVPFSVPRTTHCHTSCDSCPSPVGHLSLRASWGDSVTGSDSPLRNSLRSASSAGDHWEKGLIIISLVYWYAALTDHACVFTHTIAGHILSICPARPHAVRVLNMKLGHAGAGGRLLPAARCLLVSWRVSCNRPMPPHRGY